MIKYILIATPIMLVSFYRSISCMSVVKRLRSLSDIDDVTTPLQTRDYFLTQPHIYNVRCLLSIVRFKYFSKLNLKILGGITSTNFAMQ